MKGVDAHFHLDLWNDPNHIISQIENRGIYTIAVTNAPSVFEYSLKLLMGKKYLRAALGLHPELVYQRANEISLFEKYVKSTDYIGEVGLDFSKRNIGSKEKQIEIFSQIVEICANERNKILTLHSRKAESEVIDIIGKNFPGKAILHWYSGDMVSLKKAIEYGFYFSVNHNMILSKSGLRIIKSIPTERLLTESDGPFTQINEEKNSPLFIPQMYPLLEEILGVEKIEKQIYNNFKRMLIDSKKY